MEDEKKIVIIRKKKKVHGHGGHHGGAWKVAYADFVTAMMAFFMVMWLMGSDEETKQAVSAYFQDRPIERDGISASGPMAGGDGSLKVTGAQGRFEEKSLEKPHYAAPVNLEEYAILKDLSSYYEGSAFVVDVDGDVVKYTLTPRLRFEPGTVTVPDDINSRRLILRLIDAFKQHDGTIVIEGYSDSKQDWALAFGRALAVKRIFEAYDIKSENLIPMAGHVGNEYGIVKDLNDQDAGTVKFTLKRVRTK